MKTPYNEIVNIASIGSQTNPISLNEILRKANDEQLTPAAQKSEWYNHKRYFGNTRKDTEHRERYTFCRGVYWGSERSEHPF